MAEAGNEPSLFARCYKVPGPSSTLPPMYWLDSDTLSSATAFHCLPQGVPPRSQPSLILQRVATYIYIYTHLHLSRSATLSTRFQVCGQGKSKEEIRPRILAGTQPKLEVGDTKIIGGKSCETIKINFWHKNVGWFIKGCSDNRL